MVSNFPFSPSKKETLGESKFEGFPDLDLDLNVTSAGLDIKNEDSIAFGKVSEESLLAAGLFNSFETAKGGITSTENHRYIKWEKRDSDSPPRQWGKEGEHISPIHLEVFDQNGKVKYRILNTETGEILFSSTVSSKPLFDLDNRIIHFFKQDNIFYLFKIYKANLMDNNPIKYVHVMQVKFKPKFDDGI